MIRFRVDRALPGSARIVNFDDLDALRAVCNIR
jgi:hypothetical protein